MNLFCFYKNMKSILSILFFVLSATVFSPAFSGEDKPSNPKVEKRLSLAESYSCSLRIWNQEIKPGSKDVKLTQFELSVQARRLELAASSQPPTGMQSPVNLRFWLQVLELEYLRAWRPKTMADDMNDSGAAIAWDDLKIRLGVTGEHELPIRTLTPHDTLTCIDLHSTITMGRNDLIRIGIFNFQPDQPGVYEISFRLRGKGRPPFETRKVVEFYCPLARPTLALAHEGRLHQMRTKYLHVPLVTSTFFEEGSLAPNQNRTDRVFRSLFLGFMSKRLACQPSEASLLVLDDPTAKGSMKERFNLARQRAEFMRDVLERPSTAFQNGKPCEEEKLAGGNGKSAGGNAETPCDHRLIIRAGTAGEAQYFLKTEESTVSPEWFAQENRVVPFHASPAAQRRLFQPIKLKPLERSDFIALQLADRNLLSYADCIRAAVIEVTSENGEKFQQLIAKPDLLAAMRGETPLFLDSPDIQAFFVEGQYTASLFLHTNDSDSVLASNAVSFAVEQRQIVRDEVFALSPYDRVELTYDSDRDRIAGLAKDILVAARDSLSLRGHEITILITGHSDSLGEHRAQGIGRDYNLSLSFSRAVFLRQLLVEAVTSSSAAVGVKASLISEQVFIPAELCQRVQHHVNNPAILKIFRCAASNGTTVRPARAETELDRLIAEKRRHFNFDADRSEREEEAPLWQQIQSRLDTLRPFIPMEIVTIELEIGNRRQSLSLVCAGFGAAVPFYRRLEIAGELQEVFCRMGFSTEEMPKHLFGKDEHPSGRLMNRRVELNVIW